MTRNLPNRFAATLFAGALMLAAWLPTLTVPAPAQLAAAPVAIELV